MSGSDGASDGGVSDRDLVELESLVTDAFHTRDLSRLNVLGFGEVSVALGHPFDNPTHVCKRTPPLDPDQFAAYEQLIERYLTELRAKGLQVVNTEVRAVGGGDRTIAYLVQPRLPAGTLGHEVLKAATPDPDHEMLVSLARTVSIASPRLSFDGQVSNWSWTDSQLTLIDVGTPFLWDQTGTLEFDMSPFLPMIPAPLRSITRRELTTMVDRWQQPRGVALDIVANLFRGGLEDWVEPALTALNRAVGHERPLTIGEARAVFAEDLKTWPRLTKLKRVERAWQTRVRRRPYEFFIQTSFGDTIDS